MDTLEENEERRFSAVQSRRKATRPRRAKAPGDDLSGLVVRDCCFAK